MPILCHLLLCPAVALLFHPPALPACTACNGLAYMQAIISFPAAPVPVAFRIIGTYAPTVFQSPLQPYSTLGPLILVLSITMIKEAGTLLCWQGFDVLRSQ